MRLPWYSPLWPNSLDNQPLLLRTHGAAHEGNDILSAPLPELEDREEALDNNEAFSSMFPGTVQVEEHSRFLKAGWELVFVRSFRPPCICWPSAGICHELALLIVDRDHHPAVHDALAGMISQAEGINGCFFQAPILGEIGMTMIQVFKNKLERRIDPLLCRLW